MLLPAVEVFVAPVAFLGGDPDPEIGVIGRYGRDLLVDAEVAALFEDLHREFAAQHTGAQPFQRGEFVGRERQRPLGVGGASDDFPLLGAKVFRGVVERIALVALEASGGL